MATHTNKKIISQIKLPNNITYDIHDASAIHSIGDLGLEEAMKFMGVKDTVAALPANGNTPGDVWHVVEDDQEYIWVDTHGSTAAHWEQFGSKFVVEHVHDFSASGSITNGSAAAQEWTQSTGTFNGSGDVSVPKITKSANYIKATTTAATSGSDTFVKSYPGATSKLVTGSVTQAGAATNVISEVNPSTASVTGVSGSTTASKATAGTAIAVARVGTSTTVATGLTGGSVATWSGTVDDNGVLTISWTPNTLQSASTTNITPAASAGNITPYTFTDVTVPKAATSVTTVVTGITTDTASVATVGSAVTVATGALSSTGAGASVMTGLGTATTAKALTSVDAIKAVSLAEGTSTDGILVGDTVGISSEIKTVNVSGSVTVTGTNAASTVTGTVSHSGTTGQPKEA